jgi:hypothetical protein
VPQLSRAANLEAAAWQARWPAGARALADREELAVNLPEELIGQLSGSIETLGPALDKYEISNFAKDDPPRFLALVDHLSPRDAEIMLCFAVLKKRPTDLSILFGKAGHRAEEDLHKAAHKLAGLIAFGPLPAIAHLDEIFGRFSLERFGSHSFGACCWQYARNRDFGEMYRLLGHRGLRQQMLRAFKKLHAAEGRDAGLLAGWLLWLVDGSDPRARGWRKRTRRGRENKLGPTVFRGDTVPFGHRGGEKHFKSCRCGECGKGYGESSWGKVTGAITGGRHSGQGQGQSTVRITRKLKFLLRGANV